jgi:hypothetical protein
MRFFIVPALILAGLLSGSAFADNRNLFTLRKPVNPENLVQTFVPVDGSCHIGNLDFVWMMAGTQPKVPNGTLRCNVLKRLETIAGGDTSDNKAACPKDLPPGDTCTQKFMTAEEIKLVGQHPPLVIRAVRHANGKCEVAAFMDVGTKVVQVKQINTNGQLISQSIFSGAVVKFSGVQIVASDGTMAADWQCHTNCQQTIGVDLGCSR